MIIVFNIETIADEEAPQSLLPDEPIFEQMRAPISYKDPQKIGEYMQKAFDKAKTDRDEEISKFSLQPLTSKIVALSYKDHPDGEVVDLFGPDEKLILTQFAKVFNSPQRICTYNGKSFDIPHLAIAYMRSGISIPFALGRYLRRYDTDSHIDIYELLSFFGEHKKGTLGDWSERLGMSRPFGKGTMVKEWYEQNNFENIRHHCHDNVVCTDYLLGKLAQGMFLI